MKVISVIGTRPEINQLVIDWSIEHKVIFTGQHYSVCLGACDIKPDYRGLSGEPLGKMIEFVKKVLEKENPNCVIVYGDTRSAAAGALAANELNIPIVHSESGIRSYDRTRPEERYRVLIDHIATLRLCSCYTSIEKLKKEGITENVHFVGDPVYDEFLKRRKHKGYVLVTFHRAEHINNKKVLSKFIARLKTFKRVIFPLHPNTEKKIKEYGIEIPKQVEVFTPVNFEKMSELVREAELVITDSGGLQKEAYWAGVPLEVIGNSEWPEIRYFGNGNSKQRIKEIVCKHFQKSEHSSAALDGSVLIV